MNEYHGIVVDISQKDRAIFDELRVIGKKRTKKWVLYKIGANPEKVGAVIKRLQQNMVEDPFYFHFYKDNELIVGFKDKIFRLKTDKSTWAAVIQYGKSLGIPEKELSFFPCKLSEETY